MPSRFARLSPTVTSSTALGSAAWPATKRSRSTSTPKRPPTGAPTCWKSGAAGMTRPYARRTPMPSTPGIRASARRRRGLALVANSRSAARLDVSKRVSAVLVRRAPATAASVTAPTTPMIKPTTTRPRQRFRRCRRTTNATDATPSPPCVRPMASPGPGLIGTRTTGARQGGGDHTRPGATRMAARRPGGTDETVRDHGSFTW